MNWFDWLFGHTDTLVKTEPEIRPPVYRFTGSDEALAVRTRARRTASDAMRARAARVDGGAKVGDVLRMVRK